MVEIERSGQGLILRGRLDSSSVGTIWERALEFVHSSAERELVLDASHVEYCDGAGAALLVALRQACESDGGRLALQGLRDEFAEIVEMIEPSGPDASESRGLDRSLIDAMGAAAREYGRELADTIAYIGHLACALAGLLRHAGQLRIVRALHLRRN